MVVPDSFAYFFTTATGDLPYRYQSRLARDGLRDVLHVTTGAGKTVAAVLPWLYRRTRHQDPAVRASTPRWLVYVLPQRALVEQTVDVIEGCLKKLRMDVPVDVLMGGEDAGDREWKTRPESERIFVGTQDMVLSRLLMRGFAEPRAAWPMSFGLLHNGAQFVFDEVQLMGPGLPTSVQLQGLREKLGTSLPSRSMWMSATLDPADFATADFRRTPTIVELDESEEGDNLRKRLEATRVIGRLDVDLDPRRYPAALAGQVLAAHRPRTRTLVVLNTVDRAVATYEALRKASPEANLVLLHSRFRPGDRRHHTDAALADPDGAGSIVVSTQVLEAGVDITSETLITELAPKSSTVQRAGRCNRDGSATAARLLWTPPPSMRGSELPYEASDLDTMAEALASSEGRAVTSAELAALDAKESVRIHAVLRHRDLVDLFDTAPDISGNDIDVSPFIRDTADRTVSVAWREPTDNDEKVPFPHRDELCPAPIAAVRNLVKQRGALLFDQRDGRWRHTDNPAEVRPATPLILDTTHGGYTPDTGFSPASKAPVDPAVVQERREPTDAANTDPLTTGRKWQELHEHLAETEQAARDLLNTLRPDVSADVAEAIVLAAGYHDIGKAHETFVQSLATANPGRPPGPDRVWAKSPSKKLLRHNPKYFRHELVSALLLHDPETGLLAGVTEADLVVYLALAHHGKVRVSVRARDDEEDKTVLGVRDGSHTVDADLPGGERLHGRAISLDAVKIGSGSLTDRALSLRDRPDIGPFRLAFYESLVRAADWQVSETTREEEPHA